jgi:hypothetical protein
VALALSAFAAGAAAPPAKRFFDLPSGPASTSLKQFISQSGVQLLYVPGEVSEVVTNAVKGRYTASEAVNRLLANTGLVAVETKNGAIAVNRVAVPNGQRVALFE